MSFDKCPQCGFSEPANNRPFTAGFFPFYRKDTGEKAVMQRDNKTFTTTATDTASAVTWLNEEDYKKSVDEAAKAAAKAAATPKVIPTV